MAKPLIVLTGRDDTSKGPMRYYNYQEYFDAIELAGGLPIMVGSLTKEEAMQLAKISDGLLITGGADVNPSLYKQENTNSSVIDEAIEETDNLLIDAFYELNKPILGICRGIQIINVHFGGTLIQDIPSQLSSTINHQQDKNPSIPRNGTSHKVTIKEDSYLSSLMKGVQDVNSFHHQCVDTLAPNFNISATSSDNIVEAIEAKHILAIQWHPERLTSNPVQLALFKALVEKQF